MCHGKEDTAQLNDIGGCYGLHIITMPGFLLAGRKGVVLLVVEKGAVFCVVQVCAAG